MNDFPEQSARVLTLAESLADLAGEARPGDAVAWPVDIVALMDAADDYASRASTAHVEGLYGTSPSFTEQCNGKANTARTKLQRSIEAALAAAPAPVAQPISHAEWQAHTYTKALQAQVSDLSAKLHAATAAPAPVAQGEPVAWRYQDSRGNYRYVSHKPDTKWSPPDILMPIPLYPAAPAPVLTPAQPLTNAQKAAMWAEALHRPKDGLMTSDCWYLAGVEDAEHAHGIKATGQEGGKDHG